MKFKTHAQNALMRERRHPIFKNSILGKTRSKWHIAPQNHIDLNGKRWFNRWGPLGGERAWPWFNGFGRSGCHFASNLNANVCGDSWSHLGSYSGTILGSDSDLVLDLIWTPLGNGIWRHLGVRCGSHFGVHDEPSSDSILERILETTSNPVWAHF